MWPTSERSIIILAFFWLLAIGLQIVLTDCTNTDNWNNAVVIAKQIHQQQDVISSNHLMIKLYEIKGFLAQNVLKTIIQKLNSSDKMILIPALCLLRLSNINYEQCLQSNDKKHTLLTNQHQGNYIELTNHINSFYKSPKILTLTEKFFNAQLFLCRNSLLVNFGKWRRHLDEHGSKFAQALANQFNELTLEQFDSLSPEAKSSKLLQFFVSFYGLDVLRRYSNTNVMMTSGKNQIKKFNRDCEVYLLDPYKTLMMTYNQIGRMLPILEYHYGFIIKAYDYCLKLQLAIGHVEIEALTKYYHGMLTRGSMPQTVINIGGPTKRSLISSKSLLEPSKKRRKSIDVSIIEEAHLAANKAPANLGQPTLITQHPLLRPLHDEPAESTDSSD